MFVERLIFDQPYVDILSQKVFSKFSRSTLEHNWFRYLTEPEPVGFIEISIFQPKKEKLVPERDEFFLLSNFHLFDFIIYTDFVFIFLIFKKQRQIVKSQRKATTFHKRKPKLFSFVL